MDDIEKLEKDYVELIKTVHDPKERKVLRDLFSNKIRITKAAKMTYQERVDYAFGIFGDGRHMDEGIARCEKEIVSLVAEMEAKIKSLTEN